MYIYTLSISSALDGGDKLTPLPDRFNSRHPEMIRYPLYSRLGGLQNWSWRVQKIKTPPGFDTRTFQPLASYCTVYDIPTH